MPAYKISEKAIDFLGFRKGRKNFDFFFFFQLFIGCNVTHYILQELFERLTLGSKLKMMAAPNLASGLVFTKIM